MPAGHLRSRTKRRVFRRTPSGGVSLQYRNRKPSKAHCAGCSAVLPGVPRVSSRKLMKMPRSAKRPERPYGGMFCSRCSRKLIISTAHLPQGAGVSGQ
ncbi:50S ribosomal protein L34e [Candidatus Woesearchaeota archaeon]|nr:50S ribosomal protein L34e [Candidatus Woesearchaeota archaeon]